MCGRYKDPNDPNDWSELKIRRPDWRSFVPDYTGPYDQGLIIRQAADGPEAVVADQWAYVPPYSDTRHLKYSTFNARLDRLKSSKVWRTAFPARRCVIPMGGYFEWVPEKGAKKNRPWYVQREDGANIYGAGLWGEWLDKSTGQLVLTYTLLTTEPNALMVKIGHDRMPCILSQEQRELWLAPGWNDPDELIDLIATPASPDPYRTHPVSYAINYRDAHGLELLEPVADTIWGHQL